MAIIELENVSKRYRAARGVRALLGRGGLPDLVRGRRADEMTALDGITFSVEPGESLGLIGANGSGKSTLLKLIAGVTTPTEGSVRVYGRVASMLELGAGFHPLLSGRENIYLNAGIHGMRHAQVDAIFDHIVEFSGIAKFIDAPVATYSSGMYVRLGFAVAAHLNPDVFLIDEVLAVGDENFQRKCRAKIGELMEMGKTILFVSHDLGIVNVLCRRVVLLQNGKMIARDTPAKAIDFYLRHVGAPKGVHTLRSGDTEVVFSNGRISIFHKQEEITTPQGLRSQVLRLGAWRGSSEAEWSVLDASDTHCTARGWDQRLGATLIWDLTLQDGALIWSSRWEFDREIELEILESTLFFSVAYTDWIANERKGTFHEITPEDTNWVQVTAPEPVPGFAGIRTATDDRAAIAITLNGEGSRARALWLNSDYLTKARVLRIEEVTDKGGSAATSIAQSIRIDIAAGAEHFEQHVAAQRARRTLAVGPLSAAIEGGRVRLTYEGNDVTKGMHAYSSILIQHLWNDSTLLRWPRIEREQGALRCIGESRRFAFRLHWDVRAGEADSILLAVSLEALEPLDVQEYQTSVMLPESFLRWKTETESGTFPPIADDAPDWIHLNRDFGPGRSLTASDGRYTVMLENEILDDKVRMTPMNTGAFERARVLQVLRPAEHGAIRLAPGMHRLFAARIRVTRD